MKKLLTIIALAALSFNASAHGPSPQKVEKTIVIKAAPAKVWAVVNAFMQVTAGPGAGESTVTWVGRFYRTYKLNPPIPAGQDDETAVKFVTGVYDSGLANMKKVIENSK